MINKSIRKTILEYGMYELAFLLPLQTRGIIQRGFLNTESY